MRPDTVYLTPNSFSHELLRPARRLNAPGIPSGHVLVAQREEISSGARGEYLLKRYFNARTARRHEDEVVSEDKPASDRYKGDR